jgi:uncharacterized membrane protein YoaK (UPF0700 family)
MTIKRRRTARQTLLATKLTLSVMLPCIAGGINAIGFWAVGMYTSHMTGHATNVGRGILLGQRRLVLTELMFVGCFIAGIMLSTGLIALARARSRARHAIVLLIEATIVAGCSLCPQAANGSTAQTTMAALLCFAMGLQNALVTQAFGAVLRTTHLTGICTDLGIETTRLGFWIHAYVTYRTDKQVSLWRELTAEPEWAQLRTHFSVLVSYLGGAMLGSALYLQLGQSGLQVFVLLLLSLVVYDLRWGIKRLDL